MSACTTVDRLEHGGTDELCSSPVVWEIFSILFSSFSIENEQIIYFFLNVDVNGERPCESDYLNASIV